MAFVTRNNTEKNVAEDEQASPGTDEASRQLAEREEEARSSAPVVSKATVRRAQGGFFTIYKSGQGYWTRMGTALSAALLGLLTAWFLFANLKLVIPTGPGGHTRTGLILGIVIVVLALYSLLVWWIMNRPGNADFLIATDSEMKKVNWTSREELIGSTKVVIAFMFLMAIFIFAADILFGYLFYYLHVLKAAPF
jgi:preprotein translocase subunit SecE